MGISSLKGDAKLAQRHRDDVAQASLNE